VRKCRKDVSTFPRAYESGFLGARHSGNPSSSLPPASNLAASRGCQQSSLSMRVLLGMAFVVVCIGVPALAQDASSDGKELSRLGAELRQTQSDLADSRREIQELKRSLEELRSQVQGNRPASDASSSAPSEPTTASADQDPAFLAAKVAELHQDKVESASKYPVKLSGLILFNSYLNDGVFDMADFPSLVFPRTPGFSHNSIGATLNQTLLGLDVRGPKIFGAQTSADLAFDFGGGSPTVSFGVTDGIARLRTANIHLDWKGTSLKIGQDTPFFSPLSPTSYATVREPALSWAGNLWVWTPTVEVTHRFRVGEESALVLQGGLLDPLTEAIPPFQGRFSTAGEVTRVPAIAGRIAWDRSSASHFPFTVGFSGYRARQKYDSFPDVDSWTMNTDFKVGIGSHLEVSGEWYRGQAVGGLGGGIWTSVVFPEPSEPHTAVYPLRSTGGWGQVKVIANSHVEFNVAAGQDSNIGESLRFFTESYAEGFDPLQRNRAELVNLIYRPRKFLVFAGEYRHLFTASSTGWSASGNHVNLSAGVEF
jgi:hypothetical protein